MARKSNRTKAIELGAALAVDELYDDDELLCTVREAVHGEFISSLFSSVYAAGFLAGEKFERDRARKIVKKEKNNENNPAQCA